MPPPAAAEETWQHRRHNHKDAGGEYEYICVIPHLRVCVCVCCRMARLLCQLLSFVSTHFTLVAAPVFPIPVWRLCGRIKHSEGVCHLGSSDWERLSCPSLPQQARQSHTHRRAHAEARPEKTRKQDNNRQPPLNVLVIRSSERFPVTLLKRQIKKQQPSPTTSKYGSGVLLRGEITDFQ